MVMQKLSTEEDGGSDPVDMDIDDDSVLADGMIPDSRIVKLIDELEVSNDDDDLDDALAFLGLR